MRVLGRTNGRSPSSKLRSVGFQLTHDRKLRPELEKAVQQCQDLQMASVALSDAMRFLDVLHSTKRQSDSASEPEPDVVKDAVAEVLAPAKRRMTRGSFIEASVEEKQHVLGSVEPTEEEPHDEPS